MFYWQGGNPAIPAWAKTAISNKMQVFAYDVRTGKVAWKFEKTCAPGTRGPGLISLRCTDLLTGKLQWSQPGFRMGLAMSAAEGRIYIHSHQTLTLIEANPKAYVERGRLDGMHDLKNTGPRSHKGLLDWSMPVIAGGRMLIRTPIELLCYDIKDRSANERP